MSTRFFHLRRVVDGAVTPQGGVTVAIMKHTGGVNPADHGGYAEGKVSIGVATCSVRDNFSRKRGRAIAEGRAVARCGVIGGLHPLFSFATVEDADLVETLKFAVMHHSEADFEVRYPTLDQTVRCD